MELLDALKEELKLTLTFIMSATGKSQEEIAVGLGYNKTYISEMLSPKGKVTDKFVRQLKSSYFNTSENPKVLKLVPPPQVNEEPDYKEKYFKLLEQVNEGLTQKPDAKSGLDELVEAITEQNKILKAGFNLNDDLQRKSASPALPDEKSESPSSDSEEGRKALYNLR